MSSQAMLLSKTSVNNLSNMVFFQGVWFFTVIGAAQGKAWYGIASFTSFVVAHHFLSDTAKTDFRLAAIAILFGIVVESFIQYAGILNYVHSISSEQYVPIWILILWANLALTLNGCLQWLQGRYWLAALLGGIGGPLSYFGGIKLGAATTGISIVSALGFIAVVYCFITPLLLLIASRLSNTSRRS